jgi:cob(I)alamin adenosyltransferase
MAQFLKGCGTGELNSFEVLGIKVIRTEIKKFVSYMTKAEKTECSVGQRACLHELREMMTNYDLVVLDEILGAIYMETVEIDDAIDLIQNKAEPIELVLTGRGASKELIALADYVSEIQCIKHPYGKGIQARRGIEF